MSMPEGSWLVATNKLAVHAYEIVMGLIGIGGTLFGVWLTSRNSQMILRNQQEHEDRSRFHGHRVEAYVEFCAISAEMVMIGTSADEIAKSKLSDIHRRVSRALERIILLGPRDVTDRARDLLLMVGVLVSGAADGLGNAKLQDARAAYHDRSEKLFAAMRDELGIGS